MPNDTAIFDHAEYAAVAGPTWFLRNALTYGTETWNAAYQVDLDTSTVDEADDHDGSYGIGHTLHGLSLLARLEYEAGNHVKAYSILKLAESYADYFTSLEAEAISQLGATGTTGMVPYGLYGGAAEKTFELEGNPSITINQGDVVPWSSVDQIHMALHGLWRYLDTTDRLPSAWVSNRAAILQFVRDVIVFEDADNTDAEGFRASISVDAECARNVLNRVTDGSEGTLNSNGLTESLINTQQASANSEAIAAPKYTAWQVNDTDNVGMSRSANIAVDNTFRAVYAQNSTLAGIRKYLGFTAQEMLVTDLSIGTVTNSLTTLGSLMEYPVGWHVRSESGQKLRYDGSAHYKEIAGSGHPDSLGMRSMQAGVVLALREVFEPEQDVKTDEEGGSITTWAALKGIIRVGALYGLDLPTRAVLWAAPGSLGWTSEVRPRKVDSAFQGYFTMCWAYYRLAELIRAGSAQSSDYLYY